jgi:hypothetical protein
MTAERSDLTDLELLAAAVATCAPARKGSNVFAAQIPWSLIDALRAELEDRGVDWRAASRYPNVARLT